MLSMIYVTDLAAATLALLTLPCRRTLYLASDGQAYDTEEIGKVIARLLNKKPMQIRLPMAVLQPALLASDAIHRLWGQYPFLSLDKVNEISAANWLCESSGLWKELGRQPVYSLEDGLRETVRWYQSRGYL
jgi:nucleoside-diphosphate-sugar epimerase